MLKKYFFITPDSSTKFIIFIIILMMFAFKLFLLLALVYILLLVLFRKKAINSSIIRTTDPTMGLAPCDGILVNLAEDSGKKKIHVKVGPFKHYGIRMPFSGSVRNFSETKVRFFSIGRFSIYKYRSHLELRSPDLGKVGLTFENISTLSRAKVWVRSGDKAEVGAYLGYLPFGGKVVIDFSSNLNTLVKENDSLLSAETLLMAKGKDNV